MHIMTERGWQMLGGPMRPAPPWPVLQVLQSAIGGRHASHTVPDHPFIGKFELSTMFDHSAPYRDIATEAAIVRSRRVS